MVWHREGWAPPCDIAQDTPHEDDNHNSILSTLVLNCNFTVLGTASLAQWLSRQPREWQIRGVDPRFRRGDLFVSNYISDSGAWRYGVRAGTVWPVVSIL